MITDDLKLKLQAGLDGELPPDEAREIALLVQKDADAAALQKELRMIREVLVANEPACAVPETREFYWSKIAREIEKTTPAPASEGQPSIWALLARWFVPAGAAALLIATVLTIGKYNTKRTALLHEFSTPLEETSVVEFQDPKTGVTVVWLASLPDRE